MVALVVVELLREHTPGRLDEAMSRTMRIVDSAIVRELAKTGSQWRIYSIRLASLVCDFFSGR